MKHSRIPSDTVDRILDRSIYQIIWQNIPGDICIDVDSRITDMTRDNAVEAFREGNVLRVYEVNLIKGSVRDVTEEIEGEIEFERDQSIRAGETYVALSPSDAYYANSAGRRL